MPSILDPIPNSPFYSPSSQSVSTPSGSLILGSGISVTPDGTLLVASALGGTVSQVTAGIGLSGGTITTTGTIDLVPATNVSLGGIKVGANLLIAPDGTLSALAPGTGTVNSINVGTGLTGGGSGPAVTLNLSPASKTQFGGVVVGSGIDVTGGSISLTPASATQVGGVQLATAAEVIAGTDATKVVTPATLTAKAATLLAPGIVQLSDNPNLTSSTLAATPTAVKAAYTAALAAQATATGALPTSGGVMTGIITFAAGQTFPGVSLPKATTNSLGVVQVGPGLSINSSGVLSTSNVGTVTGVTAGPGLGAPASGNVITTAGTLRLLPPTIDGLQLGGVKAGANIAIAFDGTISVPGSNFIASNNPFSFNSYVWPASLASPSLPFPGVNGQVLTVLDNVSGTIGWTSTGTLSSVVAGTGLTVTSTPTTATVSLTTVPSITPGSFGGTALIPTFAVNAYGQITSVGLANPYTPFQIPTITSPFNLTLDFGDNYTNWKWTIQGTTTVMNPLNAQSGMKGSLLITQDPITPYVITWGTSWKFGNFAPINSIGIGEVVMVEYTVVDANYIVVTAVVPNIG